MGARLFFFFFTPDFQPQRNRNQMYDRNNRPDIAGPDSPTDPYPIYSATQVFAGFGRGSSDLGIPTANIPYESYSNILNATSHIEGETGIYYGWAKVSPSSLTKEEVNSKAQVAVPCDRKVSYNYGARLEPSDQKVFPMVMSVGWNPFYHNKERSAEIHIIHRFSETFYGADVRYVVLGYIRPELDYISKEALVDDINFDIRVALASLERPGYAKYQDDTFFS